MRSIYLFFGPPGSGKGTLSDMLGERYALPVISPGELLRHERDAGSRIGKQVAAGLERGEMVPDRIVEGLITERLHQDDAARGFIFDGFPRRESQIWFFANLRKPGDRVISVLIDIGDGEVRRRIGGRRVCECGAAYHVELNPPKKPDICDLCGRRIYQRRDDRPEILDERLRSYKKRSQIVLDHFRRHSRFIEINGGQPINKEFNELINKLES